MSRADPDAVLNEIEAMYRTRHTVFLRVATAIVGDADLARDAVHDGFVRRCGTEDASAAGRSRAGSGASS